MNGNDHGAAEPYYAVIFTSRRSSGDNGYSEMDQKMDELVAHQPGFLGVESARNDSGFGITISYWSSLEAIRHWKNNEMHKIAQEQGKQVWYDNYTVRICKVEREYSFNG
ncbi:antibiotic biosynthesis monooxygenase family protein [Paenibacillus alkalitolerans]|uniref:antibiotic biosynthesis monooxygenase family protein n=1 Tax=Paenibacillus alkalitolerans TaxID=2799335 RepID=UPI0018F4AD6F|nr:antibiotic biosynthesis monooxygenase [Paenibacillus alkalitolerans]